MIISNGGSGLSFYTEEEIEESMESGFVLPEDVLEERVEEALDEYLESEIHYNLVQTKIDFVLKDFPNLSFDPDDMEENAETMKDVRDKLNSLRSLNMDLENEAINSGAYLSPSHATWYHWKYLCDFMWNYANAVRGNLDNTEKDLIIQLRAILFKELGFTDNLLEAFGKGIAGLAGFTGEAIGNITSFATENVILPALKGLFKGAGKYIVIGVIALIIIGIGYFSLKTFVFKKIKSKVLK